ncbi:tetratricopeptide repeat protein [Euzebya rosea]|uniref:tetratricopeptide repeat protein n=1 Tax=Euzebya rosea TaxID=2052804 RepID=UPI000D3E0464|nr:tetratricopeptide repeat protein [Euzebya rosea]
MPSSRTVRALLVTAAVAALVGLMVGRFLTYSDTPTVPLPTVVVPDDTEVRSLQAAAEAAPDRAASWQALGLAATEHAITTSDPAWYAVAGDALDRAAELDPDDHFTTIASGRLALSLHDFTRARELGLSATAAAPASADAWGVLVDAHVELGDYGAAAEALDTMLSLDPDLSALARASYLRQLNGDLDGAIVAMRQAAAAGGASAGTVDPTISVLLGDLLLQRGDLAAARDAYAAAPTPAGAAGLARIAAAEGDLGTAERILSDLVTRTPAPPVIIALAEVQQRAGNTDGLADTIELARTVAALQVDAGQTVDLELALFEASFGDPTRALELATLAHDARPDNVFAAGALAWANHVAGNSSAAVELAADAGRLGTIDTAHELRMATITGEGLDALLTRNPLALELYLP